MFTDIAEIQGQNETVTEETISDKKRNEWKYKYRKKTIWPLFIDGVHLPQG